MAMVSQATVSVSTGAVNALIRKLESLIQLSEALKLKDMEVKEVNSLKGELSSMSAVLRKSAMMKAPDVQVMEWMRQVREVSYDAEDYLDVFLHQPAASGRKQKKIFSVTLPERSRSSPTRSLSFVGQLRRFRERLSEANERRERYGVSVAPVAASDTSGAVEDLEPSEVTLDPQLILLQHADPVGTKKPTEKLVGMLSDDQDKHAKVISIVGITGIGKTTLAMQVYGAPSLQEGFQCRAFVYIGRRISVRTVLLTIISQISRRLQSHDDDDIATEYDAINRLRNLLDNRRYFIIIDDVLSVSAWKAISCALPENYLGSRIILTTRFLDVARSCSSHPSDATYEMKTLCPEDSVRLFHRRVFGSEREEEKDCPNECCRAYHGRILRVCGGLPLSILLFSSFLARTTKPEDWDKVYMSTLSSMEDHQPLVSEWPRKMIHISYDSLPFPIKSCFLYLSVFPKNYMVSKDRLIWRWIAEGFIPTRGENAWRTGRSYFNELINRSLLKPRFVDDEEDPVSCTVHAAIHDFIVSLSSEENFVTLEDELDSMPRDVIRRLSLNYSKQDQDNTVPAMRPRGMNLSQARSLTVFGGAQRMPRLTNFLLLRVLDLEGAEILERRSLEDLGKLFNLQYLGLGGKGVAELPDSIGGLQLLETLDIRRTSLRKLPPAAGKLQKLLRLLALVLDDIPQGVENMLGLQVLSMVSVNSLHSLNFIADQLVKLEQLRILGLKWCLKDVADIQNCRHSFVSSLNSITKSNIHSLTIHSHEACALDFLADSWVPPAHLHKLVLKDSSTHFPKIPTNLAKCVHLSHLDIDINLDREQDLEIISKLPALTILKLYAAGKDIVIKQGFEYLKVFLFHRRDEAGLGLVFETGAMPLLRKLSLFFNLSHQEQQQQKRSFPCGLRHLSSLQQVHVHIDCQRAKAAMVVSVEDALKKEIREHGKGLIRYELNRHNEEDMIQDEGQRCD